MYSRYISVAVVLDPSKETWVFLFIPSQIKDAEIEGICHLTNFWQAQTNRILDWLTAIVHVSQVIRAFRHGKPGFVSFADAFCIIKVSWIMSFHVGFSRIVLGSCVAVGHDAVTQGHFWNDLFLASLTFMQLILPDERNAEITACEVFDAGIICVDADSWHFEEFM